jgi:hypothetical protein
MAAQETTTDSPTTTRTVVLVDRDIKVAPEPTVKAHIKVLRTFKFLSNHSLSQFPKPSTRLLNPPRLSSRIQLLFNTPTQLSTTTTRRVM